MAEKEQPSSPRSLAEEREPVEESYEEKDGESQESPPLDEESRDREGDGGVISKVPSKAASKASVNNVASIPNGGLRAWLQVLGAFMLFFNTWLAP